MPTYEYECRACHQRVEAVQKFADAPLRVCEACGGELRKVFSGVGIVFKGSGFYKTDSRGSSSASTPPATTSESSSTPASTPAPAATATSSTSSSSSSD
ncbi:MAG TPA: FmdB family zinc ribbon protein [Acidimicrobiales bacterium]